jgi:hypothetical protein
MLDLHFTVVRFAVVALYALVTSVAGYLLGRWQGAGRAREQPEPDRDPTSTESEDANGSLPRASGSATR